MSNSNLTQAIQSRFSKAVYCRSISYMNGKTVVELNRKPTEIMVDFINRYFGNPVVIWQS
jgi:hypothetical protein